MPKQTENHVQVIGAAGTARLLQQHYDALPEDKRRDMTLEVCAAALQLADFRNIINAMVQFEAPPKDAVRDIVETTQ